MTPKSIQEALDERNKELMAIPGVAGTGIGKCGEEPCIKVFVTDDSPSITDKIPEKIDGFPVQIVKTDRFTAY